MFHSKSSEPAKPQPEVLTGLERAKLEKAMQSTSPVAPQAPAPVAPAPAAVPVRPAAKPDVVATPKPVAAAPAKSEVRPPARPIAPTASEAQLIVGAGVNLKGDVLNCDVLRIEGMVEGNVKARKLAVSGGGTLLGTAEIDEAEIEGRFEGTLTVDGLLVVRGTGRATGKFAYGDIEIERGGHISGEIQVGRQTRAAAARQVPAAEPRPAAPKDAADATLRGMMWSKNP